VSMKLVLFRACCVPHCLFCAGVVLPFSALFHPVKLLS
jgi:hypothetical protein